MQVFGDLLKKGKQRFHPKTFCTRRMSFTRPGTLHKILGNEGLPGNQYRHVRSCKQHDASAPLQEDVVFPAKFLEWGAGGGAGGGMGGLCAPIQKT